MSLNDEIIRKIQFLWVQDPGHQLKVDIQMHFQTLLLLSVLCKIPYNLEVIIDANYVQIQTITVRFIQIPQSNDVRMPSIWFAH